MKFYCLTHVDFEGPANIENWALANGHELITGRSYENEFPDQPYDVLVSMGGPMSANDEKELPWLKKEKEIMESAIAKGKKVIGVCLGAQLAANVLGASVKKNPETEIGWFDLSLTTAGQAHPVFERLPQVFPVFHWHGEMFDLPAGAIHVMSSPGCANQGFIYNDQVLGFQFHMEGTAESLIAMMENSLDEMTPGRYVQSQETIRQKTAQLVDQTNSYFNTIMTRFIGL